VRTTTCLNSPRIILVSPVTWFASHIRWLKSIVQRSARRVMPACGRSVLVSLLAWRGVSVSVGYAASPVSPPPLFDNLGTLHHQITTTSELAQQYFDQGLRLVYAFNHEEAILSFQEAARQDPQAAMAYWGIALASGPNINAPMSKEDGRRAVDAIQKARTHAKTVSAAEQAYIDALSKRYLSARKPARASLDKPYADAMRTVWQRYPDDPDAGTLFAEALMDLRPWDLWTSDGKPKTGTAELVSVIEQVLAKQPDHPGACHYYIHALEASPHLEQALDCAERLPGLMPGAGHLVHMPAHLYIRIGRYHEAAERNEHATHVDQAYLASRTLSGDYADGYYSHNMHFLWASLMMEGRSGEAMKVARELVRTITEQEARTDKWKELYLPAPLYSLIRFGRWDELLREPPPPKGLRLMDGMWRLGRGLALAATGRLPGAEGEHYALANLTKQIRRDRSHGDKIVRTLLKIAERMLTGEIAARRQRYDDAIRALTDAVKLEDSLPYAEPPHWPLPIRQYLGTVLLTAGRPAEAEVQYRADLVRNPENGWALFGLVQSLRAEQKDEAAGIEEARFTKAWTHADVALTASRF
jgi:tetratricopeptide (TPR) repeat protein